ncbi:HEAT repeat domain-containing protein [Actinomadura kijaniata]|uniref:HEAT repeat domain-containing protein n=1 Tax=Actinomadura kijaniata TaxID=46161 RepID=UPI003F1B8DEF
MAKTQAELRAQLSTIESDERTYAGIGPEDVEALTALMHDEEGWLAARAVHALSRVDDEAARRAVRSAAESPRLEVAAAAASCAARLPGRESDQVLARLLDDRRPAVRKVAVRSVTDRNAPSLRRRVADLASSDDDRRIRDVAGRRSRSFTAD